MQPEQNEQASHIPQTPESMGATKEDIAIMEPGEELVTVIYKHPIGIIAIYSQILIAIIALAVLFVLIAGNILTGFSSQDLILIGSAAVIIAAFLIGVLGLSIYVYRRSKIIVTDKSLVQIIQKAIFNRKVSRLSLSNVEDVSVEQKGILASMFNFGTLTIQTAGEMDNFIFPLCPMPNKFAEQIIDARQKYVQMHGRNS